jgi:hypothetical protein
MIGQNYKKVKYFKLLALIDGGQYTVTRFCRSRIWKVDKSYQNGMIS